MHNLSGSGFSASAARWGAVVLVGLGLLAGSFYPGGASGDSQGVLALPGGIVLLYGTISPPEKHALAFGLLGLLLALALRADWRRAGLAAGGLALLGLAIELIQIAIPNRSFYWVDAGASALGGLLGVVLGIFTRWFVR